MKFVKALAVIVVLLVVVSAGFMLYMGAFSRPAVEVREMGPYLIAYEFFVGPYGRTGIVFDRLGRELKAEGIDATRGIGIYYDDPDKVAAGKLTSDCGLVIEDKDAARFAAVKEKFKSKTIPRRKCLVAQFPIKNMFSYFIGPRVCYPAITKYAVSKGYACGLVYELYDQPAKTIYFVREITAGPGTGPKARNLPPPRFQVEFLPIK